MELKMIFIWVAFVFCIGLTSGGMLILFRKKDYKLLPSFRYFQYYLLLIYTFGFYALWSKVFVRLFLTINDSLENLKAISNLLVALGVPFLIAGKAMFVWWSLNLLKRKLPMLILAGIMVIVFLIVLVFATYIRFDLFSRINELYAVFAIAVTIAVITIIFFSEINYLINKRKAVFVFLMVFLGLVYSLPLVIWQEQPLIEIAFIFLFFLGHTTFGVYFIYSVQLPTATKEPVLYEGTFEKFTEKYGISPREEEIIHFIFDGRTNKEIADKLFVTVQTIKDHTHRIYQKTDVKSRAQLTSLLRRFL